MEGMTLTCFIERSYKECFHGKPALLCKRLMPIIGRSQRPCCLSSNPPAMPIVRQPAGWVLVRFLTRRLCARQGRPDTDPSPPDLSPFPLCSRQGWYLSPAVLLHRVGACRVGQPNRASGHPVATSPAERFDPRPRGPCEPLARGTVRGLGTSRQLPDRARYLDRSQRAFGIVGPSPGFPWRFERQCHRLYGG